MASRKTPRKKSRRKKSSAAPHDGRRFKIAREVSRPVTPIEQRDDRSYFEMDLGPAEAPRRQPAFPPPDFWLTEQDWKEIQRRVRQLKEISSDKGLEPERPEVVIEILGDVREIIDHFGDSFRGDPVDWPLIHTDRDLWRLWQTRATPWLNALIVALRKRGLDFGAIARFNVAPSSETLAAAAAALETLNAIVRGELAGGSADRPNGVPPEHVVRLSRVATLAGMSKKAFAAFAKKRGGLPAPFIKQEKKSGRASEYDWRVMRPWLVKNFPGRAFPEIIPSEIAKLTTHNRV